MRLYFTTIAIGALTLSLSASSLTPDEALNRAINSAGGSLRAHAKKYEFVSSHKCGSSDAVYVFAAPKSEGFIITPADDIAPALLGYGDGRLCDSHGNMAPALEAWLSELARRIEFARQNGLSHNDNHTKRVARQPISPLCTTEWSQDAPYNDFCPLSGDKRTVTGCVATAMAQVMKYHNWPQSGEGTASYVWNKQRLEQDFSQVVFDWDNMLDSYDDTSSEAAQNAVAQLMKCAGYGVQMNYDLTSSDAQSIDIAPALGKYFRYDKSLQYLMRDYYTLSDWEDLIYNSLMEYGPVIYDAQAALGGHSFVCDGYEGDGFFHFNWGWGGLSNGYFLLDALEPEQQGIGGSIGGFNFMQDVIVGIRPDKTGDSTWSFVMYGQGSATYRLDKSFKTLSISTTFLNYGPGAIPNAMIGFEFKNIEDAEAEPYYYLESFGTVRINTGAGGFGIQIPNLPDGKYLVQPVYRSGDSEIYYVIFPIYGKTTCILTVDNGDYSLETYGIVPPRLTDAEFPVKINKNEPVTIKGTLVNTNDAPYLCYVSAIIYNTTGTELQGYSAPQPVEMEPGESVPLDLSATVLGLSSLRDGEYSLALAQLILPYGFITNLSELQPVTVTNQSGINDIVNETMQGRVQYFTLGGIKIAETDASQPQPDLQPGVYILRNGQTTRKILIK